MGGVLADQYSLCSPLRVAALSSYGSFARLRTGRARGCRSVANGDRVDLDQDVVAEEAADLDQRAGRRLGGVHVPVADRADGADLGHVDDEVVQLDYIRPGSTCCLERGAQVLEDLPGLGLDVALADQLAGPVEGNLPRDVDDSARLDIDDVAVAERRRQRLWREKTLAFGHAAMLPTAL